jgi:hypothetical protein
MEHLPRPLIKSSELMDWLAVGPDWLKAHVAEPGFPFIDLAPEGAPRRTLRFSVEAVAEHLGIPVPPWRPSQVEQRTQVAEAA